MNQAYTGVGFPLGWETAAELIYLYANDDYIRPNDQAAFQKTRTDNEHHLYAALRRALGERVHVQLAYWGTINTSNIGTFDYRRNVVSVLFDVTY